MTHTITRADQAGTGVPHRIAHAEDPTQPGRALCGRKLSGKPTSASAERCVVCLHLTRRTFVGR